MTDKQRAKLAMFQTTLRVLQDHAADYAANKALTAAVAAFESEVNILDPEHQAQRPESGGLTLVKQKTRQRVAAAAHNIGAALYAFAADPAHQDLALQAAVDYSQRTLERKSDAELVRLGRLILDHGTAHASDLTGYDVAAADLTELRDALTQFKAEQAAPRAARAEGAADTKDLARTYREAQALLRDQIDRQLARYETRQPTLFAAFQSARKPNATAARRARPAGPTPA
ncbi:hypothetical protein MUN81_20900 [Hymenobacter sp. 5317J-9]|uniref:hypothetical protein n=1 Tax=Hymenobacter sp. 5317J-9 TaxID=2932250 RepID=UPI001FD6B275|nr:hypothetical protein [Hymenobacter sp. 5317J-9]UOQ97674.1 hypothetical protein MUN81_20900 [Hymenobacter sp. 5317J-9]